MQMAFTQKASSSRANYFNSFWQHNNKEHIEGQTTRIKQFSVKCWMCAMQPRAFNTPSKCFDKHHAKGMQP